MLVLLIYVSNVNNIGSDNGLSPDRHQAIIWPNAGILLIGPLWTNLSEILFKINTFLLNKYIWKCSLENGGHFVLASMCQYKKLQGPLLLTWFNFNPCMDK